ncbi:TIGR01777 family oxidoreductase [Eudoraea chungangensis]|uniref:TIGR01777 family oxidoreductase n=1 Tax=Eudoraea chungangensis TaxID=1481905 RepID=UPI0023EC5212|nr:TIGR01777 family oxidoreductase [Eudoraea chungangensis]
MKVLITGATGLVGSALTSLLLKEGYSVHYLTTSKEKIKKTEDYTGFYWDPSKNIIDDNCFQGVSTIINLAGATIAQRWSSRNKELILNSRTKSLQTIYSAISKMTDNRKFKLISSSAIGIYPDSLANYYTEQTTEIDHSFLGEVVEAWELEMEKFKQLSCEVAIIRTGLVCSAKGGALPKLTTAVKNYMGAPFGSGSQWQSWIHIEDLAAMFLFLMEKDLIGVYNGVAPNPVTNKKMVNELAKVLNRPLILPNVPEFSLKLLLGEMSYLLLASQRVSCSKIQKKGFHFKYKNICKALESLYPTNTKTDSKQHLDIKEFV